MKKTAAMVVSMAMAISFASPSCFSLDVIEEGPVKEVFEGRVVALDPGNSLVTVSGAGQVITFSVSRETKLIKDVFNMKLNELETGSYVMVEYYRDPSGTAMATCVTMEYEK